MTSSPEPADPGDMGIALIRRRPAESGTMAGQVPAPPPWRLIDNVTNRGAEAPPLLPWRRGIGRGGRDRCHPTPQSQGRRRVLSGWNNCCEFCVGLLSPTLSSKGGEGEIHFRRRVTQTQRPCTPTLSRGERQDCLSASIL